MIRHYQESDPDAVTYLVRKHAPDLAVPIATQVALRQRALTKLPTWVQAGCLFERQLLEQATDERVPPLRDFPTGDWAVDMTAGLGVDTLALARNFRQVTAIEADPLRAELLRFNLQRLGIHNVTVIHQTAEAWLKAHTGPPPELVFLDPARRSERQQKSVRLTDCQPNVLELLPTLLPWHAHIYLKLSPLFDADEAANLRNAACVTAISLEGEVKELLVQLHADTNSDISFSAKGIWQQHTWQVSGWPKTPLPIQPTEQPYLLLPDAAIDKMKLTASFCETYRITSPSLTHPLGYLQTSEAPPAYLPARVLQVESRKPYKPKQLKSMLKAWGFDRAVVHRRNFSMAVAQIRKTLGITEGQPIGNEPFPRYVVCTETTEGRMLYLCRRIA